MIMQVPRPLIRRQPIVGRSEAAKAKRRWREAQRRFGEQRELTDMTENQVWSLTRLLVLLVNLRDRPQGDRHSHARALGNKLGWSQGTLMPRLQRLESCGWAHSYATVCEIKGKRRHVQAYVITGRGEATAAVLSEFLRGQLEIAPREHRRV